MVVQHVLVEVALRGQAVPTFRTHKDSRTGNRTRDLVRLVLRMNKLSLWGTARGTGLTLAELEGQIGQKMRSLGVYLHQ